MLDNFGVGMRRDCVDLLGVEFAPWTEEQVVAHVMRSLGDRSTVRGGWIVTPNVDILRKLVNQPALRTMVSPATVVVADGMPLVWASALQGTPLPERVTGASLLASLCAAAATERRSVFLLGGADGVADRAASRLRKQYPGLEINGWSPAFGMEATDAGMAEIKTRVASSEADLVFCGFGFPKQERIIAELGASMPNAWFVGCGASLTFAAGEIGRAPKWMQDLGLEWLHRLSCEPRRMFRRYIIEDIPFALRLLTAAWLRGRPDKPAIDGPAPRGLSADAYRTEPITTSRAPAGEEGERNSTDAAQVA